MKRIKIRLDYFKPSGKWYGGDDYETLEKPFWELVAEVAALKQRGELPGLIHGHSNFSVLVAAEGDGPVLWGGKHMLWGEIDP